MARNGFTEIIDTWRDPSRRKETSLSHAAHSRTTTIVCNLEERCLNWLTAVAKTLTNRVHPNLFPHTVPPR
ncbi:hypothetical protein EGR_06241 [Echinococcus granulosus]|uniref:Uncharacterized protein n=1 Tax=Echinococcus granulosus TaxID=6210 RepID=W6UCE1_ECHGR|nr:hypothetical protein EGR_06241 [Echinococcus granulosus]EUB58925.1 hypothetical protein EGR_06241 [Echinococcus granulosus]